MDGIYYNSDYNNNEQRTITEDCTEHINMT